MDNRYYSRFDGECAPADVAKKVNRKRVKSAYRDARFRPLFQAVEELHRLQITGGTSVTYATPSHPLYPLLHLNPSKTSLPIPLPTSSFNSESLSLEEEFRSSRFWQSFYANTPREHRRPAAWRDLSDQAALEWFHHAMRASGLPTGFTLNLSPEVEAKVRAAPSSAGWLSKRIALRLKEALGRKVDFWFAFEVSDERRLHLHGELQISPEEAARARKALRLAGGEWQDVRQHQAHTQAAPSVVWTNYSAKHAIFTKPLKGRFKNLPRPINGDWLFATNNVRSAVGRLYTERRKMVLELLRVALFAAKSKSILTFLPMISTIWTNCIKLHADSSSGG